MRILIVAAFAGIVLACNQKTSTKVKNNIDSNTLAPVTKKDSLENDQRLKSEIEEEAKPVYVEAYKTILTLRSYIRLADSGRIKRSDVVREYNSAVAGTMGHLSNFKKVKQRIDDDGDAYAEFMFKKACAEIAARRAAEAKFDSKQ